MQNQIGAPKQKLSFSDPKVRAWLFQIITIVAVVSLGWYLFNNTQTNLQHRGITSGFDFLERSAGFGIAQQGDALRLRGTGQPDEHHQAERKLADGCH